MTLLLTAAQGTAWSAGPDREAAPARTELVDELLLRWNGAGAPASAIRKAERLSRGFRARHAIVREGRRLVGNGACAFAFAAAAVVTIHAAGLVNLVISDSAEQVRMLATVLLLGLTLLGLFRGGRLLALQIAGLSVASLMVAISPATEMGLGAWDLQAVALGWLIVGANAARMAMDRRFDRMEASMLLQAAGCR